MNEKKLNLMFIIITILLVIGGIFLFKFLQNGSKQGLTDMQITPASFSFGKISLAKGQVETSFEIKNAGSSDLLISGATTSCDCTSAKFKIKDAESPIFGMHNGAFNNWSGKLKPGETGQLIVFYNPQTHPVSGPVTRTVTVFSDNLNKGKTIAIEADVQP